MGMKRRQTLLETRDVKSGRADKAERIIRATNNNTELHLLSIYFRCWKLNVVPELYQNI
jgi:hypothetical protein